MKASRLLPSLLLFLSTLPLPAADPAPAPPPASGKETELATLERFLDLSDAELEQMQRAIAQLRAMGPEEKKRLRHELENFRRLPAEERRQLRRGWGALDERLQDGWRRMMQAATPERRLEIQRELQALPPDKKADFRRARAEEFLRQEAAQARGP